MTLADRIAEYLAGTGRPVTAREIAYAVGARQTDVTTTLRSSSRFFGPLRSRDLPPRARGWSNAPEGWEPFPQALGAINAKAGAVVAVENDEGFVCGLCGGGIEATKGVAA